MYIDRKIDRQINKVQTYNERMRYIKTIIEADRDKYREIIDICIYIEREGGYRHIPENV